MSSTAQSFLNLAALIGEGPARALCAAHGGLRLEFARRASPKMIELVGIDAAQTLAEEFGGIGGVYIPLPTTIDNDIARAARNAQIVEQYLAGQALWQIAKAHGIAQRTVERIIKNPDVDIAIKQRDSNQLQLFE
jgi:hypothetical protein